MATSKSALVVIATIVSQGCGAAGPDAPFANSKEANVPKLERPRSVPPKQPAIAGSAVSIDGADYRSLDEYLAKLERDGWVGKAWYKEVSPGVYELVTNLQPPPAQTIFTRAELERKFGFAR